MTNGAVYGRVAGAYNFGAGDVIEITKKNGKIEMLPLREPFVETKHTPQGYIVIQPPEFLEANPE